MRYFISAASKNTLVADIEKLVIISSAVHYRFEGRLFAYAPYAREIDLWADLFPAVWIAAPCRDHQQPPEDCGAFVKSNIFIHPQKGTGGLKLRDKIKQIFILPRLIFDLSRVMQKADAIQVRCPGNLGLLGIFLAPFFSRYRIAKYAGQWNGYPQEPFTVRLQRFLLRSRWWGSPVLVYGNWPGQPAHIIPFFTSMLSRDQMTRAKNSWGKKIGNPPRILFVGRLSAAKNADILLTALAHLKKEGILLHCSIVGEGHERRTLENLAASLGLNETVIFEGGMSFERALRFYENADVLALASETEGWPKAVAEAMAFGLICIGSDRGFTAQMLGGGRGLLVAPRDITALVNALRHIAKNPDPYETMRAKAAAWAQAYTLEDFKEAIAESLSRYWKIPRSDFKKNELYREAGAVMKPAGIMHLIDSLDAGGAERMAVNVANHLPRSRYQVHLCVTRREGPLRSEISPDVKYLCLNRKSTFDLSAVKCLVNYIRAHNIEILHAHSTSLFLARWAGLFSPSSKIIWQVHFGRQAIKSRPAGIYRFLTGGVSRIIVVDPSLLEWCRNKLGMKGGRARFIPNFVSKPKDLKPVSNLPGKPGSRIVCLANLRPEKDHRSLLQAAAKVVQQISGVHLLLVGEAFDPSYLNLIKKEIDQMGLSGDVSLLGERADIWGILQACDIGVLSSASEAFPLALLEYGAAGLPVVATNVGSCAEILEEGRAGILVPPREPEKLAAALISLLGDPEQRRIFGDRLRNRVRENYSPESGIQKICEVYEAALGLSVSEKK